jgi:hypothetical protein
MLSTAPGVCFEASCRSPHHNGRSPDSEYLLQLKLRIGWALRADKVMSELPRLRSGQVPLRPPKKAWRDSKNGGRDSWRLDVVAGFCFQRFAWPMNSRVWRLELGSTHFPSSLPTNRKLAQVLAFLCELGPNVRDRVEP